MSGSCPKARPILKWAGGKSKSLERILAVLPEKIETYHEPFVGGGAVFFALASAGRFERAVLSDCNEDLICVYRAVQCDVDGLIRLLKKLRYDKDEYYKVRGQRPRALLRRAARIIYLNRCCFNGLYRVNRDGRFNVPFGRYKNPKICCEQSLRAAAVALQGVELRTDDFEATCERASPGDAVYLDPPYLPLSSTSRFTEYHHDPFLLAQHRRLHDVFDDLTRRDVAAVLSNSCTRETISLFKRFKPQHVQVPRAINSNPTGRGSVSELLVNNRGALNAGTRGRRLSHVARS